MRYEISQAYTKHDTRKLRRIKPFAVGERPWGRGATLLILTIVLGLLWTGLLPKALAQEDEGVTYTETFEDDRVGFAPEADHYFYDTIGSGTKGVLTVGTT